MSRRKRNHPPAILAREVLDTGIDPTLTDEFDGSVIPQPNARPGLSASERKAQITRKAIADKRLLLEAVGIVPRTTPLPKPAPQPKLAHNQRKVVLAGAEVVITVTKPGGFKRRM